MTNRKPLFLLVLASCAGSGESTPDATAAPAPASGKAQLGSFGIDLTARDAAKAPGDDFFEHANGAWLSSYELKPDERRYGPFIELRYESENKVKAIIEELAGAKPQAGTVEQKIGDFFASYMDMDKRNSLGLEPLLPILDRIEAIKSRDELIQAFGRTSLDGTTAPIGGGIAIDDKNPDRFILTVAQSGLGLPDRDYYLEDDERMKTMRTAYQDHVAKMLAHTGISELMAKAAAVEILALETKIATHHWPRTELRDADKTYNLYTATKLTTEFPGINWKSYFAASGVDLPADLIVATPSALPPLIALIDAIPVDTWKYYLRFHAIAGHAGYLSKEIDDARFAFTGPVLSGQQEQRDLWKRGVNLVGARWSGLGDAIGQVYVKRHFPAASKKMMEELVENLRRAYRERIDQLTWMSAETKTKAIEKLESFRPKIGYPDKWLDFAKLEIIEGDLFGNVIRVREFFHADEISRLSRPTDRDEWFMNPQTVNAYYNPPFNEIVFPAAILQPPFFDPNADAAVNYGAIGAVIGHEMGHGFDDQGSKYNAKGILENWWTDEDRTNFEARTKALVAQYDQYEPIPEQKVNGSLTQGENIGDLGGLSVAYHAYRLSLKGAESPTIDTFTGDQRFFLAWAQVWRSKNRDKYMVQRLKADPHSPEIFRVNGVVRNMDAWYQAFGVKPDNKLYVAPEERVYIW